MSFINKIVSALKAEPVAVSSAVAAGLTLAEAVQRHALTEGVISSAVLALLGLVTRSQVSPTASTSEEADPAN